MNIQSLPTLSSLKAFYMVALHKSFTRAAETLYLTQSALSKQVRALEEHLGCQLIIRSKTTMQLTPQGDQFFSDLEQCFQDLEQACIALKKEATPIKVSVQASFCNSWLIPKIKAFKEIYEIDFAIKVSDEPFNNRTTDIAIRALKQAPSRSKNYQCKHLLNETLAIVGSPALCSTYQKTPIEKLPSKLLLVHTTRENAWEQLITTPINFKHSPAFEHLYMLIKAAEEGLGFAIVPTWLIEPQLKEESLCKLSNQLIPSPYQYYLFYNTYPKVAVSVEQFCSWLLKQQAMAYN